MIRLKLWSNKALKEFKKDYKDGLVDSSFRIVNAYHSEVVTCWKGRLLHTYLAPTTFMASYKVKSHTYDLDDLNMSETQFQRFAERAHHFIQLQNRKY